MKLSRDVGRGGGVVDENGAGAHAGEGAFGPENDGAQIVVVADAGEDEFAALGRLARARRACPAVLGDPLLRFRRRAVVDDDPVAMGLQVARHRIAHDSQSEKRDLAQFSLLDFRRRDAPI